MSEWIEWNGGECPVDENIIVEVALLGDRVTPDRAGEFCWGGKDYDSTPHLAGRIIRYRVVNAVQETPKVMSDFRITGTGEYRTRGGEKVTVFDTKDGTSMPWWTDDLGCLYFYDNGRILDNRQDERDIIGPWVEPTVDKSTSTDHAKLIASLELAARHNDCAELLLEAARVIRELSEAAK